MIVTRTPVRVSFLGGGTDYPEHFVEHGGQTLGVAINQYSWITVKRMKPLFDYNIRVGYSRSEIVNRVDEIQHPSVRECLRFVGLDEPIEIHYIGDLPARTGLGSSSSFTVGLLHALHVLKGDAVSTSQLAEEAVHVERERIQENVGVQDQYTCALGGLLHLQMHKGGAIEPRELRVSPSRSAELESQLMLFYTGVMRHAHEVLEEQMSSTKSGRLVTDLDMLSRLVTDGIDVLSTGRPMSEFGEILHHAWMIKKKLSTRITNDRIDDLYARARKAGAIGGKLLGAGGGGFFLLYVPSHSHGGVRSALQPLFEIPFRFSAEGSALAFRA